MNEHKNSPSVNDSSNDANMFTPPRPLISADQNKSTCSPANQICAKQTTIPLLFSEHRAEEIRTRRESCRTPYVQVVSCSMDLHERRCVCVFVRTKDMYEREENKCHRTIKATFKITVRRLAFLFTSLRVRIFIAGKDEKGETAFELRTILKRFLFCLAAR